MLVVFVDDEPGVLNGIERMLFAQKVPWDVYCVPDPEEALELIGREPVDVVVADLRMPKVDGATLLRKVRDLHPNAIRIVLSAANDPELLRRSFDVAHAFLAKPCTAPELVAQVERGYNLRRMLEDPALRRLANDIGALPAAPGCYLELTRLLDDPGSNSAGVARVIGRDPALAAKVLQLCNSAFFAAGRPIADIPSAVVRLGFNTIREIVLLTEVYGGLGVERKRVERSQREAALAAGLVPAFNADPPTTEMSRTATLLAGIGDLLLERQQRDPEERSRLGPALGAYLLALWNLPPAVVQAVALREAPAAAGEGFGAAGITHVATHLARDLPLDEAYLGSVGKLPQVPHWQQALGRLRERVH